uniref:Uncharacterized protein n=1 Tax=Heterorhabditis bacteriophora TaxID=37862 RepID=A0A1I7WFD1_HETBA
MYCDLNSFLKKFSIQILNLNCDTKKSERYLNNYCRILSHLLNVLKLITDAFIYASRLVEIRYAMWVFHSHIHSSVEGLLGGKGLESEIPPEFARYLNETKDHRSIRSRGAYRFKEPIGSSSNKSRGSSMLVHNKERKSLNNVLIFINSLSIFII